MWGYKFFVHYIYLLSIINSLQIYASSNILKLNKKNVSKVDLDKIKDVAKKNNLKILSHSKNGFFVFSNPIFSNTFSSSKLDFKSMDSTAFSTIKSNSLKPSSLGDAFTPAKSENSKGPDDPVVLEKKMVGLITVNLVFLESREEVPNESEDWTQDEIDNFTNQVTVALAGLAKEAPPSINLNFFINHRIEEINGEPSQLYSTFDSFNDVLFNNGYPSSGNKTVINENKVMFYESSIGSSPNSSATIFLAKDSSVPYFIPGSDWSTSWWPHAYINLVSFMGLNSLGPANLEEYSRILVHEMGHLFNHDDEYLDLNYCQVFSDIGHKRNYLASSPTTFDQSFGVWQIPAVPSPPFHISSGNRFGCKFHQRQQDSIMKWNSFAQGPYYRPLVSWYARSSWGWGNTAAVKAALRKIPAASNINFELVIGGNKSAAKEHFSYVSSGIQIIEVFPKSYVGTDGKTYRACPGKYISNIQGSGFDVEGLGTYYPYSNETTVEGKVHEYEFDYTSSRCDESAVTDVHLFLSKP
ncbi:MAG: hypothetical protein QE271_11565 [Bacteriovoracaceae bacterium]|nr:hypothetical protein [Bacteriovoracaceae bacterium]